MLVDQLHLLFMMTPVDQFAMRFLADNSLWGVLARRWDKYDDDRKRVLERIGINYVYVQQRAINKIMPKNERYYQQDRKGKRLWLALIMQELVEERPFQQIISNFQASSSEAKDSQRLHEKELEDLQVCVRARTRVCMHVRMLVRVVCISI